MSTLCRQVDEVLDARVGRGPSDLPSALARHAATCPGCRPRLEAERLLAETLGAEPVPGLSAQFAPRLLERLERERRRLRLARRARRLLLAYWLAAATGIPLLLAGVEVPATLPAPAWVPLLVAGAGLLMPVLAAARHWLRVPGLPRRL